MSTHFLKVVPEYFEALAEGKKGFEIRKDDRDYKEGDNLVLEEYDPETKEYTGRALTRRIIYVLRNAEQYGLREGFCILQIEKLHKNHKRQPQNLQGWIPTSDRLPGAEPKWVLAQVVDKDGFRCVPRVMIFENKSKKWREKDGRIFDIYYPTCKVVAWMPLPEIYEGDKPKLKALEPIEGNNDSYNCENWIP